MNARIILPRSNKGKRDSLSPTLLPPQSSPANTAFPEAEALSPFVHVRKGITINSFRARAPAASVRQQRRDRAAAAGQRQRRRAPHSCCGAPIPRVAFDQPGADVTCRFGARAATPPLARGPKRPVRRPAALADPRCLSWLHRGRVSAMTATGLHCVLRGRCSSRMIVVEPRSRRSQHAGKHVLSARLDRKQPTWPPLAMLLRCAPSPPCSS